MTHKHAYLIIVHKSINQLKLLLQLLDYPGNDIFIHVDKKSDITEEEVATIQLKYTSIQVFKTITVYWADYSQCEVELLLLKKALSYSKKTDCKYDYLHLISGVDLPIKTQGQIHQFFSQNAGKEFVEYQTPQKHEPNSFYDRTRYYHILSKHYRKEGPFGKVISYCAVACEYICLFPQILFRVNRIPRDMEFARGSNWFSITSDLAQFILSKEKWIKKQYRFTRSGDESFLPMIVHNSRFREKLFIQSFNGDMHANMRFIDWSRGEPYVFRTSDYDELEKTDLLFARKFDIDIDPNIVEKIYSFIMDKQKRELENQMNGQ